MTQEAHEYRSLSSSDVNDRNKDKDLRPNDKDFSKDFSSKDQNKDFKIVLNKSLRPRTRIRTNITDKPRLRNQLSLLPTSGRLVAGGLIAS